MRLQLYNEAVLTCDVPGHRLRSGDIAKVVDHHIAPDGTEGYSLEVFKGALGQNCRNRRAPVV